MIATAHSRGAFRRNLSVTFRVYRAHVCTDRYHRVISTAVVGNWEITQSGPIKSQPFAEAAKELAILYEVFLYSWTITITVSLCCWLRIFNILQCSWTNLIMLRPHWWSIIKIIKFIMNWWPLSLCLSVFLSFFLSVCVSVAVLGFSFWGPLGWRHFRSGWGHTTNTFALNYRVCNRIYQIINT